MGFLDALFGGKKEKEEPAAREARRWARMVLTEVVTYHEDAVAEARREGRLGPELRAELVRAREGWMKHVAEARFEPIFRQEFTEIVAKGDEGMVL